MLIPTKTTTGPQAQQETKTSERSAPKEDAAKITYHNCKAGSNLLEQHLETSKQLMHMILKTTNQQKDMHVATNGGRTAKQLENHAYSIQKDTRPKKKQCT